jgi:phosphoribosylanthranilate isomerase
MDIEVLVEAADVIAGTQRLAASGIFTMVAVDAGGVEARKGIKDAEKIRAFMRAVKTA